MFYYYYLHTSYAHAGRQLCRPSCVLRLSTSRVDIRWYTIHYSCVQVCVVAYLFCVIVCWPASDGPKRKLRFRIMHFYPYSLFCDVTLYAYSYFGQPKLMRLHRIVRSTYYFKLCTVSRCLPVVYVLTGEASISRPALLPPLLGCNDLPFHRQPHTWRRSSALFGQQQRLEHNIIITRFAAATYVKNTSTESCILQPYIVSQRLRKQAVKEALPTG